MERINAFKSVHQFVHTSIPLVDNLEPPKYYCIAINLKRKRERHTLNLIFTDDDKNNDKPVIFKSLDDAIVLTKALKMKGLNIEYEVRGFYGTYQTLDLTLHGCWKIGREILYSS